MNKFYIVLVFLILGLLQLRGQQQVEVTIGSGTTLGYVPVNSYFGYTYSQQILDATDIGLSGEITGLKFYLSPTASITNSNEWVVSVGHTSKTVFSSTSDWVPITDLVEVSNGVVSNSNGVVEITFTSAFNYNGTDNLLIAVDENKASYNGSNDRFYVSAQTTAYTVLYYYNDYTNPDPSSPSSGTLDNYKPVTTIVMNSCLAPNDIAVSNITGTSAYASWEIDESVYAYEYYISSSSTQPTRQTPATSEIYDAYIQLDNLSPASTYYIWVRSLCSATDTSNWSNTVSFDTECVSLTPDYTNTFSSFPGNCWRFAKGGSPDSTFMDVGTSFWEDKGFLNVGLNGSAAINLYYKGSKEWLLSPDFDLSAGGYRVTFDYGVAAWAHQGTSAFGSDDKVQFVASVDGGFSWIILKTWDVTDSPSNITNKFVYNLSSISSDGVIFAFYASDGEVDNIEDYFFFVDNFTVEKIPDPILLDNAFLDFSIDTIQPCQHKIISAQAFKTAYTDSDDTKPAKDLSAWIGYSITDTNPADWGDWISATYVKDSLGNDVFMTSLSQLSEGTYYVSSRFMFEDGEYQYGGVNGFWNGTSNTNGVLHVQFPLLHITNDTTICQGNSVLLSASSNYPHYIYSWNDNIAHIADTTIIPVYTSTYYVTVRDTLTGCEKAENVTITVLSKASPLIVEAAKTEACLDEIVKLETSGGQISLIGEIGADITGVEEYSFPNPLSGLYGGMKTQMIYEATELQGLGVNVDDEIVSLGLYIDKYVPAKLHNLTIRLKHTSATSISDFESGLVDVYAVNSFTPLSTGWTDFVMTNPFKWNGSDNLLVEFVFNGGDSGSGAGTTVRSSLTSRPLSYFGVRNGIAGGVVGFDILTSYSDKGSSFMRPNLRLGYGYRIAPKWSPVIGLYTDEGATIPYGNDVSASVVYAKSSTAEVLTYTARVDEVECGESTAIVGITVKECVNSISDTEFSGNTLLSPNPAKTDLYIQSDKQIDKVTIYNLSGMEVMNMDNYSTKIDVQQLSEGIYFVKINFQDRTETTKKLIKR